MNYLDRIRLKINFWINKNYSKKLEIKQFWFKKRFEDNENETSQIELTGMSNQKVKLRKHKYKMKSQQQNKCKKHLLPWWMKIVGHVVALLIISVSAFIILVKGIEFGDEKSQRWLASLFVSFLTSFILFQPVQVHIIS